MIKGQFSDNLSGDMLCKENILNNTQNGLKIYERIFQQHGKTLKIGEHIHNPFYNDKKQSLMINQVNEKYLFNDFGNSDYKGDVFDFAALHYRVNAKSNFHELLQRINSDFQLGLKVNSQNISSNLIEFKEFNSEEYKFWNKYGITETILNKYKIKPVHWFLIPNKERKLWNKNQLIFAYQININCYKIYQPNNSRYKFSWIGKKPENYIFGYDQLDFAKDTLIITAGEKDVMTFASLGYNAVCFNSETEIPKATTINRFENDFENVIICYDNDETGKKQAKQIANKFALTVMDLEYLFKGNKIGKDISDYMFNVINNTAGYSTSEIQKLIKYSILESKAKKQQKPIPFPLRLFDLLPGMIHEATISYNSCSEQELIFLSTIAVLSGLMPNYTTIYDKHIYEANLFLYVIGKAASGKGIMNDARIIGQSIQSELNKNNSKDTKLSERQTIFVPANSSHSAFITILKANNERGILFETEADVLNGTMGQEWGDYSTTLRKSFHHETTTQARKFKNEFLELIKPKITCLISGTIDQSSKFLNTENGLYSRFIIYYLNNTSEWKNVFDSSSLDNPLKKIAEWIQHNYTYFQENEIEFSFTTEQQIRFNKFMSEKMVFYSIFDEKGNLESSIKRLGLILTRIGMILTICENKSIEGVSKVICSENSFEVISILAEYLISHLIYSYRLITKTSNPQLINAKNQKEQLFSMLPNQFTIKEAIEIGNTLSIKEDYVNKILRMPDLFKKVKRGYYEKK